MEHQGHERRSSARHHGRTRKRYVSWLKRGLMLGAWLVVYNTVLRRVGLEANEAAGWVGYIALIPIMVVLILTYSSSRGYKRSFGELFLWGLKITLVAAGAFVLFELGRLLFVTGAKDMYLELVRRKLTDQSDLTGERIEKGIAWMDRSFWAILSIILFSTTLTFGLMGTLLGSGLAKKNTW